MPGLICQNRFSSSALDHLKVVASVIKLRANRTWNDVIASHDFTSIRPHRDRRRVAFTALNHAGLIDAAKALKDQPIPDKGFTTDHLLTVLTRPLHAYTVGRNGDIGYPQDRHVYASWTKLVFVLCNENSFSNAEIFFHAIKTLNRGKVVGIPTAGGVISTGSANILDLGRMRLPGRGWFLPQNGEDVELYGAVPHVIIDVASNDLPNGKDPQLEKAIEVLKKEVKERSQKITPPVYSSQR